MKRYELNEPVTMVDKYFYDISISLRIIIDMLSGLASNQEEFAVEDVSEQMLIISGDEDLEKFERSSLKKMSVSQLKQEAKSIGIEGYSNMNKDKLINSIMFDDSSTVKL